MLSLDKFRAHLFGFNLLGCTVRSKDVFCFVAQEDYTQWPTWKGGEPPEDDVLKKRLIPFIRTKLQGQQWSVAELTGFNGILIGFSPTPPKPQVVAAGVSGGAYATGAGESSMEKIPSVYEKGPKRGAILKLKTIGDHLYVCGNGRTVGRRDGKDSWFGHSNRIPETKGSVQEGFNDIDGFNESDIYAAGGAGDVWRFDGAGWRQCAFPSNALLQTVCCGGDGYVYIGGLQGVIFKGRENTWKKIHDGGMTLPYRDMAWYEDSLWCNNDYGLWRLEKEKLVEADVSSDVKICAGNLSTRDGVLLVAGHGGAAFRQDGEWNMIFHYSEMVKAVKAGKG
jgi:hypothetical protein